MAVTPADIAVALGRTVPLTDSPEFAQWSMWVADAENQIQWRKDDLGVTEALDPTKLDYVVREAVVAQVRRPDDSTSVDIAVDDGRVSKRYSSGSGRVSIRDEWWALLGLAPTAGKAFSIDTRPVSSSLAGHSPYCSLHFRGDYCTCGANLTGGAYPLYEGGLLS